jgi:hypothetical protein
MSYFDKFPRVDYTFDNGSTTKRAVDITKRVGFKSYIKKNSEFFAEYQVSDGDTPEVVANKIYGDSGLHWVVMLFNDVINPYYDWPLSQRNLEAYSFNKYRGETLFLTGTGGNSGAIPDVSYDRNLTVWTMEGSTQDAIGLVRKYDKTLCSLEITDVSGDFVEGDVIYAHGTTGGGTYEIQATVKKAVDRSIDALHHFENPTDGTRLNPLGTPPQAGTGEQAVLGHTAGSSTLGEFDFLSTAAEYSDTLLYGYIVNDAATYVVTNFQYEDEYNETKRTIKLVRPDALQRVLFDFEKLMSGDG